MDLLLCSVGRRRVSVRTRSGWQGGFPCSFSATGLSSCGQHDLINILMMTTTSAFVHTRHDKCVGACSWICVAFGQPASFSFWLVSEGRFCLGPVTLWRGEKKRKRENRLWDLTAEHFHRQFFHRVLRLNQSTNCTLFQNAAFTASCFRSASCT